MLVLERLFMRQVSIFYNKNLQRVKFKLQTSHNFEINPLDHTISFNESSLYEMTIIHGKLKKISYIFKTNRQVMHYEMKLEKNKLHSFVQKL